MNDWMFHCKILGVATDATQEKIKNAYHASAKILHPDRHENSSVAKEKFQQLQESYEYLLKNKFTNKKHTSEETGQSSSSESSPNENNGHNNNKVYSQSQPKWGRISVFIIVILAMIFLPKLFSERQRGANATPNVVSPNDITIKPSKNNVSLYQEDQKAASVEAKDSPFPWGHGPCPFIDSHDTQRPGDFLLSIAESLGNLKLGRDTWLEGMKPLTKTITTDTQENFLFESKQASQYYACAFDILKPYLKSNIEEISGSAELIISKAMILSAASIRTTENMLNVLSGNGDTKKRPTLDQKTNLHLAIDQAWKDIPSLMIYVIKAGLMKDASPENPRLAITEEERRKIIKELERNFGKKRKDSDLRALEVAAFGLMTFLKNKQWLSADSKITLEL